ARLPGGRLLRGDQVARDGLVDAVAEGAVRVGVVDLEAAGGEDLREVLAAADEGVPRDPDGAARTQEPRPFGHGRREQLDRAARQPPAPAALPARRPPALGAAAVLDAVWGVGGGQDVVCLADGAA